MSSVLLQSKILLKSGDDTNPTITLNLSYFNKKIRVSVRALELETIISCMAVELTITANVAGNTKCASRNAKGS